MTKRSCVSLAAAIVCISVCLVQTVSLIGENKDLTAAELITKHLNSIGKPEALTQVKSRGISGKAAVQFVQGAGGQLTDGQFLCVSEGQKLGIRMKFSDIKYPGEYFAYDGSNVTVGYINPGQKSPIADFIFRYNGMMKEGYLGGVLSVAWPLLRESAKRPQFQYRLEKTEEAVFHVLEYSSVKELGDVKIKLFFEPKSFHHVKTEYRVRLANDMTAATGVNASSGPGPINQSTVGASGRPLDRTPNAVIHGSQPDSIYVLVEKFGNFANVGGLVLPQDYSIEYSVEGLHTFIAKWAMLLEHWIPNRNVDPSFFVAQK